MKIKQQHLTHIQNEINKVLAANPNCISQYESGNFHNSDKVKDLQKRFCFDLSYAAGLDGWVCDNIYTYANDEHYYTALKAICPKVTKKY